MTTKRKLKSRKVRTAATKKRSFDETFETKLKEERKLLKSIHENLEALEKLFEECGGRACYEDPVYRFYHQSFKVYYLQYETERIVQQLQALAPHLPLHRWFQEIVAAGTGKTFTLADNANWTAITRPMLEAYFHARYFLEMACKYGRELKTPPQPMPSGWAALLYLYNLR